MSTTLNWLLEDSYPREREIFIYDQLGRVLYAQQQEQASGWTPIEVGELANGVYYLQVRSSEKSWTERFVKTN